MPQRNPPQSQSQPASCLVQESGREIAVVTALAQVVVLLLGMLDYATGVKFHFAIIYLAPISFAALRGGLLSGVITSVTSTVAWFVAETYGGAETAGAWVSGWNALARLSGFSLVAVFLARSHRLNQSLSEKARDIAAIASERSRLNEELRKLSELIIAAQEAERRRIARDLHDSVNQLLSSVTFRMGMIGDQISGTNQELTEEIEKTKLLLSKGIEEIHRISEGLRPSELDSLGLAPAIRSLCREFQEKTKLSLNFELDLSSQRLSDVVELTLYRIIQEALNNIEKHAAASQATLRLKENSSCLNLTIHDNGQGFDPALEKSRAPREAGMGLLNMRERTAFLGGVFSIHSTRENGTEIAVRIPLTATDPGREEP